MSELRASACAVSRPPYDRPQIPTRLGSTSARVCRYFAAGEDVLVFGVAAAVGVRRRAERAAVADAAAVVDRQHDVALVREPLIDAVGPVVELHVVIAGHHLPNRSAVHEDDRRTPLAGLEVLRQEELVVDLEAVGRLGEDDLRLDVRVHREVFSGATPGRRSSAPAASSEAVSVPDAERLRHASSRR